MNVSKYETDISNREIFVSKLETNEHHVFLDEEYNPPFLAFNPLCTYLCPIIVRVNPQTVLRLYDGSPICEDEAAVFNCM